MGGFVHFADIQHEYVRFYPHRVDGLTFDDVFIDGERSGYLAADRTWGLVSFGWISPSPVCFFGEPLVSRLRARRPALLAALLPINELATTKIAPSTSLASRDVRCVVIQIGRVCHRLDQITTETLP